MKTPGTVAVGIGSLITPGQVLAQPVFQPPFGCGGWGAWWWVPAAWLAVLALVAAAVFLVLWIWERRRGGLLAGRDSALEVLKLRYARGEIDRREFGEKRKDLL